MTIEVQPLSNITWIEVDKLSANDYNPNNVLTPEMKLLKLSLLKQGWIQPVLVARDGDQYAIIDGFHRSTLCKTDSEISALTDGKVPCCVLDLTRAERMALTVRINRAKGTHVAVKMHDLVSELFTDHNWDVSRIAKEIGGTPHEVETLLLENVFKKYDSENHEYTKAWVPIAV